MNCLEGCPQGKRLMLRSRALWTCLVTFLKGALSHHEPAACGEGAWGPRSTELGTRTQPNRSLQHPVMLTGAEILHSASHRCQLLLRARIGNLLAAFKPNQTQIKFLSPVPRAACVDSWELSCWRVHFFSRLLAVEYTTSGAGHKGLFGQLPSMRIGS